MWSLLLPCNSDAYLSSTHTLRDNVPSTLKAPQQNSKQYLFLISPTQTGSPVSSALQTVIAADSRLTVLQREAELLEADAEEPSNSAQSTSLELPAAVGVNGSQSHPRPPAPPSPATSGLMRGLEEAVASMSMEEKVSRLEEVYEDLDALVRGCCLPTTPACVLGVSCML